MRPAARIAVLALAWPLMLAGCAGMPDQAVEAERAATLPTAMRVTVTGVTAPVLSDGAAGRIEVLRDGDDEAIALEFENGARAVYDLQPGRYNVASLGALQCRGVEFDVDPAAGARDLGSLRADIIETDYHVALMSAAPGTAAEAESFAERARAAPGAVDARPIAVSEAAPCFLHKDGTGMTWRERPLGEKILLGIGFAGFCAIAVASGGFCAF